jgi:predicted MFS family arabinose efflux permease
MGQADRNPRRVVPQPHLSWATALQEGYRWVIVALGLLNMGLSQGTRQSFGVLLIPLTETFGWGRGAIAGAVALSAIVWAVSATPLGALLDRWGPRWTFAGAAALSGLGLLIAAGAQELWQLYLGVGLLTGLGFTPLTLQSQAVVVSRWFVARRGLAVGIVGTGVGLGLLVLAPLTQWLLDWAGWQSVLVALAALFMVGLASLNAFGQRQPADDRASSDAAFRADAPPAAGLSVGAALREPRFWALAAVFGLGPLPTQFLVVHSVAFLVDRGITPQVATTALGLSGAGIVAGMILWGYLADRWGAALAYTVGSVLLMAGIALLSVIQPGFEPLLAVYAALFALGFAARQGLNAVLAAALIGGPSFATLMGVLTVPMAAGVALGPAVGGWLFDQTGSYAVAFVLALFSTAVSIGCAWLAAPQRGRLSVGVLQPATARPTGRG